MDQILGEKKAEGEDADLVKFRRGRLVRRAVSVRRCMEWPCPVTLSRSEGSSCFPRLSLMLLPPIVTLSAAKGLSRWAERCFAAAQQDRAVYLPRYLSLITRNARPLEDERVPLHMLR